MHHTALRRVLLRCLATELTLRGLAAALVVCDRTELLRVSRRGRVMFVACVPTSEGRWAYVWSRGWALVEGRHAPQMIKKELAWFRR